MNKKTNQQSLQTAMILAAGFGTRMQELSRTTPKPLLRLNDHRIIDVILFKLAAQGIKNVIINLHYLGEQIRQHINNGERYDLQVLYSEETQILGTGGGIAYAESLFNNETILTMNADVLSDISFHSFFDYHEKHKAIATMAVVPSENNKDYSLALFDDQNQLCGFLGKDQPVPGNYYSGIYTGNQILSSEARSYLKPKTQSVINGFYLPAIANNEKIQVFPFDGQWVDLGLKESYLRFRNHVEIGKTDLGQFMK